MEQPGAKLRLFSTLDDGKRRADAAASAAASAAAHEAALAASGQRWGPLFRALTRSLDMPTTALLLQCVSSGSSRSRSGKEQLPNFGSAGGSAAAQAAAEGELAAAMAERLLPGWWWLTCCVPAWRWQATAALESPCFGVPGLCRYTAARAAWVRAQLSAAIEADGCRQARERVQQWCWDCHACRLPAPGTFVQRCRPPHICCPSTIPLCYRWWCCAAG